MYTVPKGSGKQRYEPPSPSYCSEDDEEREEYFVTNPDFEFDELPQPFRFIDKILVKLLDRLSFEIDEYEKLKELKSTIKPLPVFNNPSILDLSFTEDKASPEVDVSGDVINQEGCIEDAFKASAAHNTIYIATGKKLKAINCFTKMSLAQAEVETQDSICILETIPLGTTESGCDIDMVVAFDDSGNCFSHLFNGKEFFPVKILDGCKPEHSKVLQWKNCNDLSIVAITKHQPGIGSFLEVYRIPKNEWISEYESAMKAFWNAENRPGDRNNMAANEAFEIKSKPANSAENQEDVEGEDESQPQQKPPSIASYLKLKSMVAIATLKQPSETSGVIYSPASKINDGGRIGSGYKDNLGMSFYKTLRSQLENELSGSLSVADESIDLPTNESIPTIHFLKGFSNKVSTESKADQKHCPSESVGVWWSSANQFLIYKLPKSSRDGDLQLEYAYKNADMIFKSCVNEDTSLIVLALQNNNVIIWNRLTGEPSNVILLEESDLHSMEFAKLHDSSESLIFGMKSGDILQLNYSTHDFKLVPVRDQSSIMQSDLLCFDVAPDHPSLLFVAKKPDMITVFDLNQQSAAFHFQLPVGFCLDHSLSQCFMLNNGVPMILVFAVKPLQDNLVLHGLFAYNICISDLSYQAPQLYDTDSLKIEETELNSLESIALKLMMSVHSSKQTRAERQQKRWREFGRELKKRLVTVSDAYLPQHS